MSDFERDLQDLGGSGAPAPPIEGIRARAQRIRRRRITATVGTAVTAVLLVAVAVTLPEQGPDATRLADRDRTPTPAALDFEDAEAEMDAEEDAAMDRSQATATMPEGTTAPRGRTAGGTAGPGGAGAPPGDASPDGLEVVLEVGEQPVAPGEPAHLTLQACNRSSEPVEITFQDSQRYDFEVYRYDRLVWRWSDDRAFMQVLGTERWEPGECTAWSEEWPKVDGEGRRSLAGRYQAVGILTGPSPTRTEPRSVCLAVCD